MEVFLKFTRKFTARAITDKTTGGVMSEMYVYPITEP
jgi:hypothetical protein